MKGFGLSYNAQKVHITSREGEKYHSTKGRISLFGRRISLFDRRISRLAKARHCQSSETDNLKMPAFFTISEARVASLALQVKMKL